MQDYLLEKDKQKSVCDCGQTHFLDTQNIVVSLDAFDKLLERLINSSFQNVLVMSDLKDSFFVDKLKIELIKVEKEVSIITLPNCLAYSYFAQNIEDKNQDLVVALGGEELISLAKYYAYSFDTPLFIFPVGNFCDFTFSKYARIFDGVQFNFYIANTPQEIYVSLSLNKYNEYQFQYIASKYLALFDNKISSIIFKKQECLKMESFLKRTLQNHLKHLDSGEEKLNKANIWTLIRLGQAMTYFNSCKFFFGSDRAITDMLCSVRRSSDYLEVNTISFKLVLNSYDCFLKKQPYNFDNNLNKHIDCLSKFLKISPTEVLKRLVNSELLQLNKVVKKIFQNYQLYLYELFRKLSKHILNIQTRLYLNENILKKYGFEAKQIEKAFALCANFYDKPCLLHIIYGYGYLDKLLKNE